MNSVSNFDYEKSKNHYTDHAVDKHDYWPNELLSVLSDSGDSWGSNTNVPGSTFARRVPPYGSISLNKRRASSSLCLDSPKKLAKSSVPEASSNSSALQSTSSVFLQASQKSPIPPSALERLV